MMLYRIGLAVGLAITASSASADDEDLFKKAYAQGYDAGFAAGAAVRPAPVPLPGTGTVAVQPGTLLLPGSRFDTVIGPGAAAAQFELSPDSSVAIIPNNVLKDMEQKLGDNYMQDKNVILNNAMPNM